MLELFGLGVLLLAAIFWVPYVMKTTKKGAPFVPLEPEVVEEVMKLAKVGKDDIFYDLGSGDGRLVIAAALRGAKEAYGVEIDSLRVFYSRLWLKIMRCQNAKILKQDIFKADLSKATVVTLYLLQETNDKLVEKLRKELPEGARIVSIAFSLPGWEPVKVSPIGPIYGPTYLYKT
jgi:predicted RNA methylase